MLASRRIGTDRAKRSWRTNMPRGMRMTARLEQITSTEAVYAEPTPTRVEQVS